MKDTKAIFSLGMTALEVVIKIMKANPCIKAFLFKIYTSKEDLEKESVIQIQTSLDRMIHHNPPEREEEIWLEKKEITLNYLNQTVEALPKKRALAITSGVKVLNADKIFHIPMMDFDCRVSSENLERIQKFLRKIKQEGVVLLSGRSYHYYGIKLLPERDWLVFLGKCLLFDCTDSRNVGHRLIDGYASLRISKKKRRPNLPKVVAII